MAVHKQGDSMTNQKRAAEDIRSLALAMLSAANYAERNQE